MALKDWPDGGFPGTAVNPRTLAIEVVDAEQCESALAASTDPADQVRVLLASSQYAAAADVVADARLNDPSSFRLRLLDAEVLCASGRYESAQQRLRRLAQEVDGTDKLHEVLHQLGKVNFAAGDFVAARGNFSRALDLRVDAGSSAALIYASATALVRASDRAEGCA